MAFEEILEQEEIIREIRRTLEANHMTNGVHIRLTLTRGAKITSGMDPRLKQSGPTLIVLPEWKAPVYDKTGLTMVTSSIRRFPPDCLDPKIHHNNLIQSILAKVEANVAGVDTALMLDREGFIAEANGTHVFLVAAGAVTTSAADACPEGVRIKASGWPKTTPGCPASPRSFSGASGPGSPHTRHGRSVVFKTVTSTPETKSPLSVQAIVFFPPLFMLISQPVKVAVVGMGDVSSGAGRHSPINIAPAVSSNNSSR